ncbi:hypothetical protein ACFLTH_10185, partial [Bacteroidota bacterium]
MIDVIGTVTDASNVTLTVGADTVQITAGNFTHQVSLTEGLNTITVTAEDEAGNTATETRSVTLDAAPPLLTITAPADSTVTNLSPIGVTGTVTDATNITLTINADTVLVTGGAFIHQVSLTEGQNTITVTAVDEAGNTTADTLSVTLSTAPPEIIVSTPPDDFITDLSVIEVAGSVTSTSPVTLTVNSDTVLVVDDNFTKLVDLTEGMNRIIITVIDEFGGTSADTVSGRLDTENPALTVSSPYNGSIVLDSLINVYGTVTDSSEVDLIINTDTVVVQSNGSFEHTVFLFPGDNIINVHAIDAAGNDSTLNINVTRFDIIIPPPPFSVAPPLDDSYANTFYDSYNFLWDEENPIQFDADPESFEPNRLGVVRGTVIDINGDPLMGVKVSVPNHPEWGYTNTRLDGDYDIGLNGGGYLVVNFEKIGYRPAQRIFDSPWNRFVVLDTVALVEIDPESTVINFEDTFEVVQSSISSDADGARRATIFFEQGTVTTITLPDNSIQQLSSITARATEFTKGTYGINAMPADLPESVSYTYCTELTADEALALDAVKVEFDKTARLFTENFIGLPVGTLIPTGLYDWEGTGWIPLENGFVIKIVDVVNDTAMIAIDASETAASSAQLDSIGITPDERVYIASLFNTGQTLWRTELDQFGIIDQGFGSIAPETADVPKIERIERFVNEEKYSGLSPTPGVDVLNQTLNKQIDITGTPFQLTYSSDRVEGRESQLVIPLTGETIQPSLVKIILKITIIGIETELEFPAQTDLSYTYVWDGKDIYGRIAPGRHKADILIGYVHASNYQEPVPAPSSFGSLSGVSISGVYSRDYVTLWQCTQAVLGTIDNRAADLGGWNLNINHGYDPVTNTLYLGGGQKQISESLGYILQTIAGTGSYGSSGHNVPAVNSPLAAPKNITVAPDGSVYFIEYDSYKVKKIDTDGILTTVAGNGTNITAGDGGLAIYASIYWPTDIDVDEEGNLYILQGKSQSGIRKVDTTGIITTIAGINGYGYEGDGGPAADAKFWRAWAMEIGPDGCIYVADQNCVASVPATPCFSASSVVRKIDTDGVINTIAGGGDTYNSNPQTIPATEAVLDNITDLRFGPDGDLYIVCQQRPQPTNPLRHIILKLGKDGRIHKITAGGYTPEYNSEGKPASSAKFLNPREITFDRECSSCFTMWSYPDNRILTITPDYILNTIAGRNVNESSPDGTPAKISKLSIPYGIDTGPDGNIYFVESNSNKIRKLILVQPGQSQDEYFVNSNTGQEIYVFNSKGKHIRTEDALTAEVIYQFTYDAEGRLIQITDIDNLTTTIERDTEGTPTAIISPRG